MPHRVGRTQASPILPGLTDEPDARPTGRTAYGCDHKPRFAHQRRDRRTPPSTCPGECQPRQPLRRPVAFRGRTPPNRIRRRQGREGAAARPAAEAGCSRSCSAAQRDSGCSDHSPSRIATSSRSALPRTNRQRSPSSTRQSSTSTGIGPAAWSPVTTINSADPARPAPGVPLSAPARHHEHRTARQQTTPPRETYAACFTRGSARRRRSSHRWGRCRAGWRAESRSGRLARGCGSRGTR